MTNPGRRYPNQQLRAVSLEVFFRGRMATFSRFERVQERFKDELPDLFVPSAIPNEPSAMRPYHLRSADGQESLAIAVNQVALVSFDYPGHAKFLERVARTLPYVLKEFGVEDLARVLYRYENELALVSSPDEPGHQGIDRSRRRLARPQVRNRCCRRPRRRQQRPRRDRPCGA